MTILVEVRSKPEHDQLLGQMRWQLPERLVISMQESGRSEERVTEWITKELAVIQLLLLTAALNPKIHALLEDELGALARSAVFRSPYYSAQSSK